MTRVRDGNNATTHTHKELCQRSTAECSNCDCSRRRSSYDAQTVDQTELQSWLDKLQVEHRDLDVVIQHLIDSHHHDNMRIQRLKRRKLKLKDMILKLESELIPDLDA